MIITIDGPTGTGKSTIAKLLAEKLGYVYFDTGAMYRCMTYGMIKHAINHRNQSEAAKFIDAFEYELKMINGVKHYFYENEDISNKIRESEVTGLVSEISAIPAVREKLVKQQRQLGQQANAVFEGRDMGTVVFPHAEIKIFLNADPTVRAKRRFDEFKNKQADITSIEQVLESLKKRDAHDSGREHSPLKIAEDAHVIDTTHLNVNEVLGKILEIISK